MSMSEERQGEIAYAILLNTLRKKGVRLNPGEIKRQIGNTIQMPELQEIELRQDEAEEFVRDLLEKLFSDVMEELK